MSLSRRITRVRTFGLGAVVALVVAAVPFVASAASTKSKPSGGTIHLYYVNTSIEGQKPGKVLITGAFSDHGTEQGTKLHLQKGTITGNLTKLNALFNSKKFATGYRASCSFSGSGSTSLPIVSGTGAYAGIHGSLDVHVIFGAQSPTKKGKCDGNAAPVADQQFITGSGKMSF